MYINPYTYTSECITYATHMVFMFQGKNNSRKRNKHVLIAFKCSFFIADREKAIACK